MSQPNGRIHHLIKRLGRSFFPRMEVENLSLRGNTLQATFGSSLYQNKSFVTCTSSEYKISGAAIFQVKVNKVREWNTLTDMFCNSYIISIFIKFSKLHQDDDLTYTIKLTSKALAIVNKNSISDDGSWHLIYESENGISWFDVTVHLDIVPSAISFAMLYEDTELTDFELRGEDGSVSVHRLALAAASPVLRRMLAGTWREAAEGRVDVPGTSKDTLQNLKDYIYLHTIPDNGLEQLLLLASCYMIKDLEQICAFKLVSSLTAENVFDLLDFTTKHKMTRLFTTILKCIKCGTLDLDEMSDHLHGSK